MLKTEELLKSRTGILSEKSRGRGKKSQARFSGDRELGCRVLG